MSNQYLVAIRAMQEGNFSPLFPAGAESDPLGMELSKLAATLEQKRIVADLLQNIMHEVAAGLLVDDVLDHIYDRFHSLLHYNRMGLALLSEDRTTLTVLDAHRAGLDAGHARRAAPERLGADDQQVLATG